MSSSARPAVEMGVVVMAFGFAPVTSQVLIALNPKRRLLIHWAAWTGGSVVAVLPLVAFGSMSFLVGFAIALFFGSGIWGAIELRMRWRRWLYFERPARLAEEEKRRAYHPTSFSSD